MVQTIAVVGKSKSGKTTLIERLIPELKKRGYRVRIGKACPSWIRDRQKGQGQLSAWGSRRRYRRRGIPGRNSHGQRVKTDSLDNLEMFFTDMDLVLVEGYKGTADPKIEVFDHRSHKTPGVESKGTGRLCFRRGR